MKPVALALARIACPGDLLLFAEAPPNHAKQHRNPAAASTNQHLGEER
jgi:hypothetical protein